MGVWKEGYSGTRLRLFFLFFAAAVLLLLIEERYEVIIPRCDKYYHRSEMDCLVRQYQKDVAKLLEEKAGLLQLDNLMEEKSKLLEEVEKLKHESREKAEDLTSNLDDEGESIELVDCKSKDEAGKNELNSKDLPDCLSPSSSSMIVCQLSRARDTLDEVKEAPADFDPIARERRGKVRAAMIHAFGSYEKYAWGHDELMPMSQRGRDEFGGLGATIIDSLDTLFIMGLHDEFEKATEWVSNDLNFHRHYSANVFETTIKILGGLISAYDLSGNRMFLIKAQELADRLSPAWGTATGIPVTRVDLANGPASNPRDLSILSDIGSVQLEFIAVSQRTGIPRYAEMVEKVIWKLKENFPADGLLPVYISVDYGRPTNTWVTFGAMGGSFYEYLLKVWIQGNRTHVVQHYRDMWEQSMEGLSTLVKKSTPSSDVYIAERNGRLFFDKMDACFAPGMLALGADGTNPSKAKQYLDTAEGLARTCYNMYMSNNTHLAGENYHIRYGTAYNILRPETVESLFYLWRKTGDTKYRDWGWDIFQAFETHSRVSTGYVGARNVNSGEKDDTMQAFFLAETLKYLYLLFSPSSVIPLDEWVFNTEGHPIKIKTRTEA